MKAILSALSLAMICFVASAQNFGNDSHSVTVSLLGGSSMAYLQVNSAHRDEVWTDAKEPFSFGLNVDVRVNDYFSIKPGIFYAGKGGLLNPVYSDDQGNNISVVDEYKLHYFEIPVDLVGHMPFASGANIFLGAGPYFAYALSGTNNQTVNVADPVLHHITFGKTGDFKQTDYGVTTTVGFEAARGWSIGANVDWGLTNIMQNNTTGFDATKLKTITVYFSIGQRF